MAVRPLAYAIAVLRNRTGGVPRPAWCTYLVTYRCNARCRMCDSWRLPPGAELTPGQVAAVFGKFGRLDVVRITGGEPFLRPDLPELAEAIFARARPRVLHVSTNGSLPERIAAFAGRFSHPRRLRFMVSFDGLAAEHDANRGPRVDFARALETVRRLAELRRTRGLGVSVNHTVSSKQSLADSAGLREVLGELGVEVHSVLAYAESAMYTPGLRGQRAEHLAGSDYPLHPELGADGAAVREFVRGELARVGEYRSRALRIGKRYYLRGLSERLEERRAQHGMRYKPRCVALRSHVRLLPDGRVPVCQFNTETVGSLLDEPFEAVWGGRAARAARAWVDACPGCWAECEVIPNAIYTADILRPR